MSISIGSSVTITATLLGLVAVVYLVMAVGARHGELVWAGSRVGRLPAEQRWWSLIYGVGLIVSALVLVDMAGNIALELVPDGWLVAAGFVVTCILGTATLVALFRGSSWERMFFAPITFLGAGLAYWLTFTG